MSALTEIFKDRDPSLLELPEITNPEYTMFNDGSVEVEVAEFLYGFVRMLKPNNILETGTYLGVSSAYMAKALKENNKGLLTTLEIDHNRIRLSEERWKKLGVEKFVVCDREYSLEYDLVDTCELMFLDSEPYYRFQEVRRFYPMLAPGGYIFIHDTPRNLCQGNFNPDHPEFKSWPFGDINKEVKNMVLDFELIPFNFGTPRGMFGLYKPHPEDFKWGRA